MNPMLTLTQMRKNLKRVNLLKRIHEDQRGAVSLEHILIIGAIAIPILIFLLKFGWPKIRDYFNTGMTQLENQGNNVIQGQ